MNINESKEIVKLDDRIDEIIKNKHKETTKLLLEQGYHGFLGMNMIFGVTTGILLICPSSQFLNTNDLAITTGIIAISSGIISNINNVKLSKLNSVNKKHKVKILNKKNQ